MEYKIQTKEALESFVCGNWDAVNTYIETLKKDLPIPFYSSVDVRESKTKYAPVDHNMYPAGFNNLCSADFKGASTVANETIKKLNPDAKWIGIFPESNTKNLMYLDHLTTLGKLIEDSGYTVRLLSFDPNLFPEDQECLGLTSANGSPVTICKASIRDGEIFVNRQKMDLIICNNDQSNPWPVDWATVKTTINPTPKIGWFRRQKNIHFTYYKKVADEFCAHFEINPDLIQAKFAAVEEVDFENKNGLEKLGSAVDGIIKELKPGSKVFVKASQGTYGMGISVVSSGEEIINMNRKTRNKMDIGKNSIKFTSLLVQEGVETIIKYDDMPAEITIYLVDGKSIGGFMRVNGEKDDLGNLNSRGMVFRKLCMGDVVDTAEDHTTKEALYSVIARLSTIASAYEIKEVIE
ncbi:MAG: glutamate--cysteine ligase [Bacteriovorax sp.]|nr:glutamate--cysteine ligase [Bacteriovorax sp.]